jgi:hypothetical protein
MGPGRARFSHGWVEVIPDWRRLERVPFDWRRVSGFAQLIQFGNFFLRPSACVLQPEPPPHAQAPSDIPELQRLLSEYIEDASVRDRLLAEARKSQHQ